MNTLAQEFFGHGLKDLSKMMVGIDSHMDRLMKTADVAKNISTFPPYNIIRSGENSYRIELAVAGFQEEEIDIELDDGNLIIKGETKETDKHLEEVYLFKGIANRSFKRTFILDEYIEVKEASLVNGMLIIHLEKIVPEHLKPRKIAVTGSSNVVEKNSEKELLLES